MTRTILKILAGLAAVVAVALGAMYYVAGTPQYSLYQLRRAALEGDRETFYRHFDTGRVISSAVERAVGGVPAGPRIVSQKATEVLVPAANSLLRDRIDERLAAPEEAPILRMELDGVRYANGAAYATLRDPSDGSTTTVTLVPAQGRHWKVVELDLAKANVVFTMDDVRRRAEEILPPEMPEVANPAAELPGFPAQAPR